MGTSADRRCEREDEQRRDRKAPSAATLGCRKEIARAYLVLFEVIPPGEKRRRIHRRVVGELVHLEVEVDHVIGIVPRRVLAHFSDDLAGEDLVTLDDGEAGQVKIEGA